MAPYSKTSVELESPHFGRSLAVLPQPLNQETHLASPLNRIPSQSPQVHYLTQLQAIANSSPPTLQRKALDSNLPDHLRSGIESLSGVSMEGVNVHYNSSKPATLQAHAYAQGRDIHLAPGQEQHLPHEAWHIVQQAQGRVKPTLQLKGVAINDDTTLEREADEMGARAMRGGPRTPFQSYVKAAPQATGNGIVQGYWRVDRKAREAYWNTKGDGERVHPMYPPLGFKLLLTRNPAAVEADGKFEDLPNKHQGHCIVHTPHRDDEELKKFGQSLEVAEGENLPPVGSQVVLNTGFTATVTRHSSGRENNKPKAILQGAKGILNRGLTAEPAQWFFETDLESDAPEHAIPDLRDISFGFNEIYRDPTPGIRTFTLNRESKDQAKANALEEFQRATGSKFYAHWGDYNLESEGSKLKRKGKLPRVTEAMGLAGVIRFNLDGLSSDGPRSVAEEFAKQAQDNVARMGNFTIAELYAVVSSPALLAKTKFYEMGEEISHAEAEALLGIRFQDW